MAEIHYLISDASKQVDVEAHVLRYWEDELELQIPRNDMGHRYYTEFHIRLFQQIKDLKEKGYQLKAIKTALDKMIETHSDVLEPDELFSDEMTTVLSSMDKSDDADIIIAEEKMEQFQKIMNLVIGRALEENNERLSQDISTLVADKVANELDYLMRVRDEKEEERFKQLDETIRAYQKDDKSRAEAAAAKIPFFQSKKKKKFGRSGRKL